MFNMYVGMYMCMHVCMSVCICVYVQAIGVGWCRPSVAIKFVFCVEGKVYIGLMCRVHYEKVC